MNSKDIEIRIYMIKKDIENLRRQLAFEAADGAERMVRIAKDVAAGADCSRADSNLAFAAAEISRIYGVIKAKQQELECLLHIQASS